MRKFFNITENYRFEIGDYQAATMWINVLLIFAFGYGAAWFALPIAIFDFVQTLHNPSRHINILLLNLATISLNVFFLSRLYS